jgi:hypothetical protein
MPVYQLSTGHEDDRYERSDFGIQRKSDFSSNQRIEKKVTRDMGINGDHFYSVLVSNQNPSEGEGEMYKDMRHSQSVRY